MQSVYKLPIAMAVLRRVDEGRLRLDQKVHFGPGDVAPVKLHSPISRKYPRGGVDFTLRSLLRAAIVDSDGAASDLLLGLVPANEVTAYLRTIGVNDLVVATSEKAMASDEQAQYQNWTTPECAVVLL